MAGWDDIINQLSAPPSTPLPAQGAAQPDVSHIDTAIEHLTAPPAAQAQAKAALGGPMFTPVKPGAGSAMTGFSDALAAALQRTAPQTQTIQGQQNYQLAPAAEQWKFQELGVPSNQQKYVALRGPSGNYQVYERNQNMAEGPLTGIGRMLSLAQPETGIPAVGTAAAGPNAAQSLLQDFTKAGVTPSLPAVGQGRTSALTSQIMNVLPVMGPTVRRATGQTMSDTANAAERIAGGYGSAANPLEAGEALQKGLNLYTSKTFPQQTGALYDQFNQLMQGVGQVSLDNTLNVLKAPMARFPTSPQLGSQLTNSKLQQFTQTLSPKTVDVPAVLSSIVDENGSAFVLQAAKKLQTGGTLTFPELQELRSTIGRAISDPALVNDIPRADLKRVYAGISQDLESAAGKQSPEALGAFQAANRSYKEGVNRIDALEPLLKGSPEQSFAKINQAASSSAGANLGLLQQAQKVIAPEDWGNVGAAVIRRLGEPTPGAKDILGHGNFSASSFSTNWNKISDAAKDTLFGANLPNSTRSDLDALARVAQAQKNVSKLANTSHSGEYALSGGLAAMALEHREALLAHPIATVAGVLGSRVMAQGLMSPGFAKWLYGMPSTIAQAPSAAVGAQHVLADLENLARTNPQLMPAYNALAGSQPAGAMAH